MIAVSFGLHFKNFIWCVTPLSSHHSQNGLLLSGESTADVEQITAKTKNVFLQSWWAQRMVKRWGCYFISGFSCVTQPCLNKCFYLVLEHQHNTKSVLTSKLSFYISAYSNQRKGSSVHCKILLEMHCLSWPFLKTVFLPHPFSVFLMKCDKSKKKKICKGVFRGLLWLINYQKYFHCVLSFVLCIARK